MAHVDTQLNTSRLIGRWQRSADRVQVNIEGCERMLERNHELLKLLTEKYFVSNKRIIVLKETVRFIENEFVINIDDIDNMANMIIELMDKKDGHNALALIPTMKNIKETCLLFMSRLDTHKQNVADFENVMNRTRRLVLDSE
ncbi:hypothetical protein HJC23_002101 [Cyclotella cryptica]|uniref:Uncharacterized protein n=1 Tax=Cyclotella cryptica TaxID=29204 RepID=A0ABD3P6F6_9STRA